MNGILAKRATLDAFDRKLLHEVQADNLTAARVLAERVGLSESAVLRRLRRLRRDGIIVADVSVVDASVLGTSLTVLVLVTLEREGLRLLDEFVQKIRKRPEVEQAWYVTGEADFVLRLALESMGDYEIFCEEVLHVEPNVRGFRTMVAMKQVVGGKPVR